MVDFHNRSKFPFLSIRRQLEAGELGKLLAINIRLERHAVRPHANAKLGGAVLTAQFLGAISWT